MIESGLQTAGETMRIVYFLPGPMSRGPLGPPELVRREAFLNGAAFGGTAVEVRETDDGPASVESSAEEYLSVPGILHAAPRLEAEGFDAMIIGCFGDPGLAPARELVDFPVIGPGQAGALAAAQMGQRFAIITVVEEVVPAIRRQMRGYGLEGLVADIRAVDVPVLELRQRADQVLETLETEAHAALRGGADTLVLGCMTMGFLDVARKLGERLGVPVINPVLAALKAAESFAATGLRPSPRAYPPPRKEISPVTV
ncbi:aspartate/glutamate racemase family protein [Candidatus Palauibacter sp.]|uniref:aspartate/glutamate racemase family protein n=1 Tax=Candidatus Palauibacter sp. TaxID=3101350 RepID=UPI003D0E47D4